MPSITHSHPIASNNHLLVKRPTLNREYSKERQLKALKSWIKMRVTKHMVWASLWSRPEINAHKKTASETKAVHIPAPTRYLSTGPVKMVCLRGRGFWLMMSKSGGSTDKAIAGKPSVARFTYNS